jgi:WD domain, G-beta repeat
MYAALAKPGLTAEIGRFVEIDVGLLVGGTVTAAIDQTERLGGVGQRDHLRRDPAAAANGLTDAEQISFRRPRHGIGPKGEARQVQDAAYSPDGTILATAHWYNADPGEVKLWDTKTGKLVVSLPVTEKDAGVLTLKFSPDGKILAGSVVALPRVQPPGVVVLWDVAGHRELKTLRGHSARITALAFTPGGYFRTASASATSRSMARSSVRRYTFL